LERTTDLEVAQKLTLAVVGSSHAPALLLDGDLSVIAASTSFYGSFHLEPQKVIGRQLFGLGNGEWDVPQLRSLLTATLFGHAWIEAYEMDLKVSGGPRRLVLHAQRLDYGDADQVRLMLTMTDVTEARLSEKHKDDLLREKSILLKEIQHRVANSLQIIASVLMQSARQVQSAESRGHLQDAHNRVMSIATVQQQLAASRIGNVELRAYLSQLCQSLGASMIQDLDRVSIEVTVDDSSVAADVSVSLGLIVTELVINALKHAFPGGRQGAIFVDYHALGQDWTMSVSDDGVGTPESIRDARPGLGSSIVEALANQLEAVVETEARRPGVTISIVHTAANTDAIPEHKAA
jgi:two-component sensor histidine kinase